MHNMLLQSMLEIIAEQVSLIRPIAQIPVDQNNGVIIPPMTLRHMSVIAMSILQLLILVKFGDDIINEVNH